MMMRGNNRSSSGPSNCVRRKSSSSSNFKASRQKVAPPKKRDVHSTLMQQGIIQRVDTKQLIEKLDDREIPGSLKRQIKREIETRQHEEDEAVAAAAAAVILEQTPQLPPQPATASPWLIDKLYDKRGPERAKALAGVIALLNQDLDHDDLKKRYVVELLYRCLSGVKKGSTKEVQNALQVIGLLSIIVDCEEKIAEIYREFLAAASTSSCLKKAGTNTTKMLECLGVVSFFGAINAEETQVAMKVIWDFLINLKSESNSNDVINRKKQSQEILVAAINSWCFLLTSMEGWRLNHAYWRGAISFFMDLLDNNDDIKVHVAACAALALIFEIDALDKFWNGATDSTLPYSQLRETLRLMVLEKLSSLHMNSNAVEYFETLHSPMARPTICGKKLESRSWYQVIQLAFLRSFLGKEFENFMTKEKKLQSFFEFNPNSNNNVGAELFVPTVEEIMIKMIIPEGGDSQTMTAEQRKKERALRASIQGKAKTQLRTKHRLMSEALNCCDC
ncbi:uncharacterized protein LOC126793872 [Argentina anserina]|uniref:uncharacterized protein LOC126793872 n=1 Tax=Argentina anserina TaxID=57926 RepID=UPI0021762E56|nr:uncharacterized protein LOC126793872 [Potentilla anserina]